MFLNADPRGVYKKITRIGHLKFPERERCCSAANCVIYYTYFIKPNLKENYMFDIKTQCKQVEDAMKQVFDYWLGIAEDTIKIYKKK